MKLFLTSDGISTKRLISHFKGFLPSKNLKAVILYSKRKDFEEKYLIKSENELLLSGIKKENISKVNISKPVKLLTNFDVIYVCGGNTFYIWDRIKKTGLDKIIKKLVSKGSIYVGVSAGSIIATKNISIAGFGSEADDNDIKLKQLKSFGFVDFSVYPHYYNKLNKEIKNFENASNVLVKKIKNKQALIVLNKKVELVK